MKYISFVIQIAFQGVFFVEFFSEDLCCIIAKAPVASVPEVCST